MTGALGRSIVVVEEVVMTKFQQRCSVLSVLVPALGLAGCMASPDDVARVAQPISEADGGVADGSAGDGSASPFIEAPRPPTVRTARDVAAFLDRVARRSRLVGRPSPCGRDSRFWMCRSRPRSRSSGGVRSSM